MLSGFEAGNLISCLPLSGGTKIECPLNKRESQVGGRRDEARTSTGFLV